MTNTIQTNILCELFIGDDNRYHYFYKIINIQNNKFYFGVHTTKNINDNYKGSGTILKRAYEKYGIISFKKDIIKCFHNQTDKFDYEKSFITEDILNDPLCYNAKFGGHGGWNPNKRVVIDDNNNTHYLNIDDIDYSKYHGVRKGTVTVKDSEGNTLSVSINDEKYNVGEYKHISSGKVIVKDHNNNITQVDINDPRYLSGELIPYMKGSKVSEETNEKHRNTIKERGIMKDVVFVNNGTIEKIIHKSELSSYIHNGWIRGHINKLAGEKNGMFNKKHITNGTDTIVVNVTEVEHYLQNGWKLGRTLKYEKTKWMKSGDISKKVPLNDIQKYLESGWTFGKTCKNKENILKANQNKCWIHKDNNTKMIYKTDIEKYLSDGWLTGRH